MVAQNQITEIIKEALSKINGSHEKDICRYLPAEKGGYLHHFTMKRLKRVDPEELERLLEEFILEPMEPRPIEPKPRMRHSKPLAINHSDLRAILSLAQEKGDRYLLSRLGTKLPLAQLKKALIKSIKEGRLEEELWIFYVQAVRALTMSLEESHVQSSGGG